MYVPCVGFFITFKVRFVCWGFHESCVSFKRYRIKIKTYIILANHCIFVAFTIFWMVNGIRILVLFKCSTKTWSPIQTFNHFLRFNYWLHLSICPFLSAGQYERHHEWTFIKEIWKEVTACWINDLSATQTLNWGFWLHFINYLTQ